jgi:uncharacterized FlaG/YvyC family protein
MHRPECLSARGEAGQAVRAERGVVSNQGLRANSTLDNSPSADDSHRVAKQVRKIFNEANPVLLNTTLNRLHKEVNIETVDDLETCVKTIFDMITNDTIESIDSCQYARNGGEYADIVNTFRTLTPVFDIEEDGRPMTFTRILVNMTKMVFTQVSRSSTVSMLTSL